MAIGVPLKEIYHSTLVDLHLYDDAYKIKEEINDTNNWMMGMYVYEAISVVVSNAFASKGAQHKKYRDKPILAEYKDINKPLTEEEKQAQIDLLFSNLELMKTNFENSHGDKKCQT